MTVNLTQDVGIRGLRLIEKWEGLYLKAYRDSVGIWTIGWGSITNPAFGIKVYEGLRIDRETAEKWLAIELTEKAQAVDKLVKVPLTVWQRDTLISFAYNVGIGALQKSTLLKLLNRGNYEAVPAQLMRYSYGGGKFIQGLANRRRDEGKLWRNEHIDAIPDTDLVKINASQITAKKADNALSKTLDSATGKAASTQAALGLAAATQFLTNPAVIVGCLVVAVIGGIVLYRKYRDTQDFR